MVLAKNYETMSTFVKVMHCRKNSGLFFSGHGVPYATVAVELLLVRLKLEIKIRVVAHLSTIGYCYYVAMISNMHHKH